MPEVPEVENLGTDAEALLDRLEAEFTVEDAQKVFNGFNICFEYHRLRSELLFCSSLNLQLDCIKFDRNLSLAHFCLEVCD